MTGRLKDMSRSRDGEWIISFSTPEDFREEFDQLYDKDIVVEIKRKNRRRSLDANAYCWVLVDKIAEKTGIAKSEVYRKAIREIGGVSTTICVMDKAVEFLIQNWERNGLGWQVDTTESKLNGCTNVILYYGSSVFDSAQMARLINSLVQDAEALGIPTITPKEERRLIEQWGLKEGNHVRDGGGEDHSTESERVSQAQR